MSWLLQWEDELGKLDELFSLLAQAPPSPESEIAQEHIQSARSCVLGSRPAECELNLDLARVAIAHIADTATRRSAQKILVSLPSNRKS
jgi:hypothetical protein